MWWVHRRGGTIASAHAERQPGYAEEALEDTNNELAVYLDKARNPVPLTARSGDFWHAIVDLGWLADVNAAVDALADSRDPNAALAKVLRDRASRFERNHPLVLQIATAIGKDSDDLDALFRKTLEYDQ